jgi:hypothetical protein
VLPSPHSLLPYLLFTTLLIFSLHLKGKVHRAPAQADGGLERTFLNSDLERSVGIDHAGP